MAREAFLQLHKISATYLILMVAIASELHCSWVAKEFMYVLLCEAGQLLLPWQYQTKHVRSKELSGQGERKKN